MITPEGFWDQVEKSGGCWLWTGPISGHGYGTFTFYLEGKIRSRAAHRVSYMLCVGTIPEGLLVDHKCHTKLCVNPAHLRPVTHKQNAENRQGAQANSKSGVRGVHWDTQRGKWKATLAHNGKRIFAGMFDTVEAASYAVIQKRNELFTHNDADRTDTSDTRRISPVLDRTEEAAGLYTAASS